ncbi:hypothetical protein CWI36_1630p0010, partial [Hamiltosporidium magnivora]
MKYELEEELTYITKSKTENYIQCYNASNNELVSVNDSSRGLKKGSVRPPDEAIFNGSIMRAEMHEEPTPLLKEGKREEDGAKNFKPKNKAPFISKGGTTLEEPT